MGQFPAGARIPTAKLNDRHVQARQSAGLQSIGNNSETILNWDVIDSIDGITWSGGTAVAVPISGLWTVSCTVRWTGNATGYRRIAIYVNSTLFADQAAPAIPVNHPLNVAFTAYLAAGQTIDARALQTSGGSLGFAVTSRTPNLIITKQ
ncbi:hypothetical protein [Micromonospora sp. NPDC003816]|uniref:hypothetical protein n=1 Tax=Micromonospora sp. NPDC003816 TaxID=3364224 RepID=UPI0036A157A0